MSTDNRSVKNPKITKNFVKTPLQMLNCEHLTTDEKCIINLILSHDECYVSQKNMAKRMRLSKSTVQRVMSNLFKMNIVRKVTKQGWSCYYVVNPFEKWDFSTRQDSSQADQ